MVSSILKRIFIPGKDRTAKFLYLNSFDQLKFKKPFKKL